MMERTDYKTRVVVVFDWSDNDDVDRMVTQQKNYCV
jgi:hypothetical protein